MVLTKIKRTGKSNHPFWTRDKEYVVLGFSFDGKNPIMVVARDDDVITKIRLDHPDFIMASIEVLQIKPID